MKKFMKVQSKLDPEVQTLLKQYFEALNRFRLGEELHEAKEQEVAIGIHGQTEVLEPFNAFVHHKEFQIAQLLQVHQGNKSEAKKDDGSNAGNEDAESFFTPLKLYRQQQQLEMFWNSPIDFDDEDISKSIQKDIAPFIVLEDTPMSKLHFLFIMLNISQVNIVNQGQITGIISKLEFLKRGKQEEKLMREQKRKRRLVNVISQAAAPLAHLGTVLRIGGGHRGPANYNQTTAQQHQVVSASH